MSTTPVFTYDPKAKAAYVKVSDAPVYRTDVSEWHSGNGEVNIDWDAKGNLVGVEILL